MTGDVCAQVLEGVKAERRCELSQLFGKDAFYDTRREGVSAATGCRGEVTLNDTRVALESMKTQGVMKGFPIDFKQEGDL